jgi:putative ABC transport system substrate-binding protein
LASNQTQRTLRAEPSGNFLPFKKAERLLGLLGPVGMTGVSPVLIEALEKLGYQQGRNLKIIFRSAKDSNAELPELAAALVNQKPDVLVAFYTPPALALKNATAAIPIVMVSIGDPITTGLVKSLAHPGGNITGTANASEQWGAKRLQMVTEMLPGIRCLTFWRNPTNQSVVAADGSRKKNAEKLGLEFEEIDIATPEKLDQMLAGPVDGRCKTALFLPLDGLFLGRRAQIAEFALRQKIALFAPFPEDAEAGALMAFGINLKPQLAVVEQQIGARRQGRENLRMRQRHALPVSRHSLQIEPEPVSGAQFNRAIRKRADAQLRPLQIHHDSDRTAHISLDVPDRLKTLPVILVISMAEIQPEHIDACVEQGSDHRRRRTGRSKRSDDFRVP